jgi:hypothetical protein
MSILAVIVMAVNLMVEGLAAIIGPLVAALPDMPDLPTLPSEFTTAASWIAWIFPVSAALAFMAFALTAWIAWQIVAFVLRWSKLGNV